MRLAGCVDWSGSQLAARELRRRGLLPNGADVVGIDPFVALAARGADADTPLGGEELVFSAQAEHVALIADARLDNADELRRMLGLSASEDLGRVLIAAYLKWGEGFPDRLRGDFAIVAWDSARRTLVACRDPFGVRPLVYRRSGRRLWIASQPGQLASTFDRTPELDDQAIVEHVLWCAKDPEVTAFKQIRDVRTASLIVITEAEVRGRSYWSPPAAIADTPARTVEDYYAELRHLLYQAVKRRLPASGAVLVHVSGGLDSSSIALAANQLVDTEPALGKRIVGCGAVFPGLDCDESIFIDAVARRLRFDLETWDGTQANPSQLLEGAWDGPGFGTIAASGDDGDLAIAKRRGAGVVLSGLGGDDVMMYRGIVRDMFARGEWRSGLKYLLFHPGSTPRSTLTTVKAFLGQYLPLPLRQARARASAQLPEWLVPRLHTLGRELTTEDVFNCTFLSHVQRNAWARLRAPYLRGAINAMQAKGTECGLEYRFPYLDRELVEFVLALPTRCLPDPTPYARIHRAAFRPLLPVELVNRFGKAEFGSAVVHKVKRANSEITDLLGSHLWASERYVEKKSFTRFWRAAMEGREPMRSRDWCRLWSVIILEPWLRRILGYHSRLPEASPDE